MENDQEKDRYDSNSLSMEEQCIESNDKTITVLAMRNILPLMGKKQDIQIRSSLNESRQSQTQTLVRDKKTMLKIESNTSSLSISKDKIQLNLVMQKVRGKQTIEDQQQQHEREKQAKQHNQQQDNNKFVAQYLLNVKENNLYSKYQKKKKKNLQFDKDSNFIDKAAISSQKQIQIIIESTNIQTSTHQKNSGLKNKIQRQKLLNIKKQIPIKLYFPYNPYQVQQSYLKQLITALENSQNALLQSPTGTGKTLCLLSGVLAWVQYDYRKLDNPANTTKKKIIYLSRTHTQLRQAQNQLLKTCYRPTIALVGSREQLCIKKQFDLLKGSDKIDECNKAVKITLLLRDQQKLNKLSQKQLDQYSKRQCQFYATESRVVEIAKRHFFNKIIDGDAIKQQGRNHGFCPYYYPNHIKSLADIYFMPYNYLLDVSLLPRYRELIKDSILIFDEGHNIPEAAATGRNCSLTTKLLQNVEAELKNITSAKSLSQSLYHLQREANYLIDQFQIMKKRIITYFSMSETNTQKNFQDDQDNIITKVIPPQRTNKTFYDILIGKNYLTNDALEQELGSKFKDTETHDKMVEEILKKFSPIISYLEAIIQILRQSPEGKSGNLEKITTFLSKTLSLVAPGYKGRQWIDIQRNHYRLFIKNDTNDSKNYTIQLICLTPSLTMKEITSYHPRSIIITSGTLAPLWSWSQQLQLPFKYQLQNKHVIKSSQLQMHIVKHGKNGVMNFGYQNTTSNPKIYEDLANCIIETISLVPNGVLVIFPSYRIKKEFDRTLKYSKLENTMNQIKPIFSQQKGVSQNILGDFKKKAQTKQGAVLLIVCRGKLSEGMDFSDELCRAVIFIGVPYANIKDPLINQKKNYLSDLCKRYNVGEEKKFLNSNEWYDMTTMRAVNQALGRVIRHIDDFGMIFLFDERYSQKKLNGYLPSWAKESLKVSTDFKKVMSETELFFQMNSKYQSTNVGTINTKKQRQIQEDRQKSRNHQQSIKYRENAFTRLMGSQKNKIQKKKTINNNQFSF